MNCRSFRLVLIAVCLLAFPFRSPAPLVFRAGEGWTYEPYGGEGRWQRLSAKEQLVVAQAAFDQKGYSLALKAARYLVLKWPTSDYAPQAQYLLAHCYEATGKTEKAFKEYQKLLEKQPKFANFEEIRQRQREIADGYLAGKRFKRWGFIPYRSMERTAGMYADIVKTGPYSDVAPQAQLQIGTAWEKQKTLWFKSPDYPAAVQAYNVAADRYYDQPQVASEAIFRAGLAYHKQAQTADRDQTTAEQAIAKFTDFMALYPNDSRVPQAQKTIVALRSEQARGNFDIARFYEKRKKWDSARIYYNEVLLQDPNSPYATEARQRIDQLKLRIQGTGK
jgi:outer membrane protein assembly factor BamD (BamD/ComL family)